MGSAGSESEREASGVTGWAGEGEEGGPAGLGRVGGLKGLGQKREREMFLLFFTKDSNNSIQI